MAKKNFVQNLVFAKKNKKFEQLLFKKSHFFCIWVTKNEHFKNLLEIPGGFWN